MLNPAMEYIIAGKHDPIVLEELLKEGVVGVLLGASGQAANYVYNRRTGTSEQTQEQDTVNLLADALLSQQEQSQQQTTAQTDTTVEDMRKKLAEPVNRSQADKIVKDAQAQKEALIAEAEGQVARFNSLYTEYKKFPLITKERMFYEAMEEVLPGMNIYITDGSTQTLLPLDSFSTINANGGTQ